ncbi:AbgT family transporter [Clostridium chauvoei]|uniref:AbgT family transporter n=2 Tax=Clostridium chauvoei TaxID=46867 RepID=A0ABD4RKW8_9CLOT|nr:AbgT family transporter [Clostridium chauvoei]ATD54031.1 aminobenzoyl-glutamate transporter [Clostridium chauvoei]ATD58516.1 aminobenzoyl-glutamate transporter [Clostridium chauvoei]MBX7281781.1 AbgT family transporter [Clostridium chauvoei]MBX7284302.1 AbgT family transporter [Clostridium chauvoei]MBX7286797.1 AbgT family transporter [Clostridium chauvoei]
MKTNEKKDKSQRGILASIERVGNKLPHPGTIFVILCAIIMVLSAIFAKMGVSVTYTGLDRSTMEIKEMTANVVSLLTPEGIRYMFTSAVTNFTGFAPLGTVLVALLGVGVAEGTGLIGTLLTKLVTSTPKRLITVVVVFAGVMSSIASDAGYVVLVPLGAIIFLSFGRHPLAGLAAAFAGVSGGFSANLIAGPTDALLAGITSEAAKIHPSQMAVGVTDNWYFIMASTILITIIGTIITEKVVEPKLGKYKGNAEEVLTEISTEETRGLKFAGIAALICLVTLVVLLLPGPTGILRNPETGQILKSPFMDSIVLIIALFFFIPGVAYGIGAKKVKDDKDVIALMSKSMATMGGYIVLVFFAAQFVQYFNYTHLGTVIAVKGADFLQGAGITGIPLIIGFVIITAFINLFMGSASAKWAIMAPIFVPMLMNMQYSPALVQMAYRIGDSTTNIISPLMSYFALIVAFAEKYDDEAGAGTLITTMLPYSLAFLIGWTLLLIVWYMLKLPLGPGAGIMM